MLALGSTVDGGGRPELRAGTYLGRLQVCVWRFRRHFFPYTMIQFDAGHAAVPDLQYGQQSVKHNERRRQERSVDPLPALTCSTYIPRYLSSMLRMTASTRGTLGTQVHERCVATSAGGGDGLPQGGRDAFRVGFGLVPCMSTDGHIDWSGPCCGVVPGAWARACARACTGAIGAVCSVQRAGTSSAVYCVL